MRISFFVLLPSFDREEIWESMWDSRKRISAMQFTTTVWEKSLETRKFEESKENLSNLFMISTSVERHYALTMQRERCLMLLQSPLSVIERDAITATTIQLPCPRDCLDSPRFLFKRLNESSMEWKIGPKSSFVSIIAPVESFQFVVFYVILIVNL
jgi:hypothetical protein